VTPYSQAQWRAIDGLARRVDVDLTALDVRLTQGGEPTFVAMAGGSAPEWNYTADGSGKRRLAARLLRRLGFSAPSTPGEYIFVCTFPGHWVRMYGVMLVVESLEAFDAKPTVPIDPMTKQPFVSGKQ